MAFGWMSQKQYAIVKGQAEKGDKLAREILEEQEQGISQEGLDKLLDEFFSGSGKTSGEKGPSNIKRAELSKNIREHIGNAKQSRESGPIEDDLAEKWASGASQDDVNRAATGYLDYYAKKHGGDYGGMSYPGQENIKPGFNLNEKERAFFEREANDKDSAFSAKAASILNMDKTGRDERGEMIQDDYNYELENFLSKYRKYQGAPEVEWGENRKNFDLNRPAYSPFKAYSEAITNSKSRDDDNYLIKRAKQAVKDGHLTSEQYGRLESQLKAKRENHKKDTLKKYGITEEVYNYINEAILGKGYDD